MPESRTVTIGASPESAFRCPLGRRGGAGLSLLAVAVGAFLAWWPADAWARSGATFPREVRRINASKLGVPSPVGLAFSPRANAFFVLAGRSASTRSTVYLLTHTGDPAGFIPLALDLSDPLNMAFDARSGRLLVFEPTAQELITVEANAGGYLKSGGTSRFDLSPLGLQSPKGLTVDPQSGAVFILDAAVPRLVKLEPGSDQGFKAREASYVELPGLAAGSLRGVAFNPTTGHLHLLSEGRMLYEVTAGGERVAAYDLSKLGLGDSGGLVFAPSGDLTDDAAQLSLYVADARGSAGRASRAASATSGASAGAARSGGSILELSFASTATAVAASTFVSSVVSTTLTSQWSPPAPDTSDVVYMPATNTLRVVDSEVEETVAGITLWAGVNEWETTLEGTVLGTFNLTPFTKEPTGVSVNPANGHLFYSNDEQKNIFEINPGPDGQYHTADDIRTSFSTSAFGSNDCEDVTYDPLENVLYLADGVNAEVYRIAPGANGLFDGVPPAGDDVVTHFDTSTYALDPECLTVNTDNNHLYIGGSVDTVIQEISTTGTLLQTINIGAANALNTGGVGFGPRSNDATARSLYLVQRGVDNDAHPTENDGKLWEMTLPGGGPVNQPPSVNAGADQAITLPASANLDGTVSDDGQPGPLTTTWTMLSGPGTVAFGDATAVDTTASFSAAGVYSLRLTANDGAAASFDDVVITVNGLGGSVIVEKRVAAGTDDAEQNLATGSVGLTSTDLELMLDGTVNQAVGMRFTGVTIPQGAAIVNAWVQFKVDETGSTATSVNFQGQAADNPLAFTTATNNITLRPRTVASVNWVPPAWTVVGQVGAGQQTPNLASVIQEIVSRPGWVSGNPLVLIITGSGKRTAKSFNGEAAGAPLLHVEYGGGGNQPPSVSAGTDQTITLPASANLDGTVTDDGQPGPLTTTWTLFSGPGTVTFGASSAVDTTASFSTAGVYTLRLTANDGAVSVSDDVVITVNAAGNQPPSVNAGADQTITLPASANLDATVSDDGQPGPLTTTWTMLSGPGTVAFGDATAVDTTASFSTAGVYSLRLTANDGAISVSDDVVITVNSPGGSVSFEKGVAAGTDDAEQNLATGSVNLTSTDLELMVDGTKNQAVGMRFTGVTIPQGAAIVNAWVQFKVDETGSTATSVNVQGQAADNPLTFTTAANDVTLRPRTVASVNWVPAAWTVVGQVGPDQQTPSLTSVIQEIVSRPGWVSGNPLVLIITGTGKRTAVSFNGNAAGAPLLHVEYTN